MVTGDSILKESIEKAYYHKMMYLSLFVLTDNTKYFHQSNVFTETVEKLKSIAPVEVLEAIDYRYIDVFAKEDAEELYNTKINKN